MGTVWGLGRGKGYVTITAAEDEDEDGLQAEEVEEIPGEGGYPSHIEVARRNAGLEHRFEADGERKWKFHYQRLDHRLFCLFQSMLSIKRQNWRQIKLPGPTSSTRRKMSMTAE